MSGNSMIQAILAWLSRRTDFLVRIWNVARNIGLAVRPMRFSLLMVLAGIAFLFLSDQGLDTLRDFAERKAGRQHDASQTLFFFLGAFLWAYGSWYWARILVSIRFETGPDELPWVHKIQTWLPRLIGLVAILALMIAFWRAATPYADVADSPGLILKRYALYSLMGAVGFAVFTLTRRDMSGWLATRLAGHRLSAPLSHYLGSVQPRHEQEYGKADVAEAFRYSWPLLLFTILVAIGLLVAFAISPEATAPQVGSTPILLLASAGWIAIGSAADLFGMRTRFPVFITLFLLAVAFSFINDNHAVRVYAGRASVQDTARVTTEQALRRWQNQQLLRPVAHATQTYPLFIVAAEGGGIRAAYWTATVLGRIQDSNPCFADQLFALSGVSGGSLGAAVFTALLADSTYANPNFRCGAAATTALLPDAQAILGEDFLAPTMAAMLYPDLLQRILPVPVAHFDRARVLETAWERAWRKTRPGSDRFAEPFGRLWHAQQDYWLPALFLNSTWVETGKRLIASNLQLADDDFSDVEDLGLFYGDRALSLSTAVHLSARFTYVSPAGTLTRDHRTYGHAVDGGYFENSGTTTALEILKTIDQLAATENFWRHVEPYVILVANEPADLRYPNIKLATWPKSRATTPSGCCNEVLSPLTAMLNTRGARGAYARETTRWHVGTAHFLQFGLCKNDSVEIPLGWTLSKVVRDTMQAQLASDTCTPYPNRSNLEQIGTALKKRFARR